MNTKKDNENNKAKEDKKADKSLPLKAAAVGVVVGAAGVAALAMQDKKIKKAVNERIDETKKNVEGKTKAAQEKVKDKTDETKKATKGKADDVREDLNDKAKEFTQG